MDTRHDVVAPDGRVVEVASSWTAAQRIATDLTVRFKTQFTVRPMRAGGGRTEETAAAPPFMRERRHVVETAHAYIQLAKAWPKAIKTEKALKAFKAASRKYESLMAAQAELVGSDFVDRCTLATQRTIDR